MSRRASLSASRATRVAAAGAVVAAVSCFAGCAEDPPPSSGACAAPSPAEDLSALPGSLRLDEFGVFTEVVEKDGYLNAVSITEGDAEALIEPVSIALEEAGYVVVAQENEIIEADVYFARGASGTGGVKFLNSGCTGRAEVRLFYAGP